EYLNLAHGIVRGMPPALHLIGEAALQRVLIDGAVQGIIRSAHDCAEGGVAIAIAECCFDTTLGVEVDLPGVAAESAGYRDVSTLFGESASRAIVSVSPGRVAELLALAAAAGVPAATLGIVGGDRIRMAVDGRRVLDESRAAAEEIWSMTIEE